MKKIDSRAFDLYRELLRDKMQAVFIESNLDASADYAFLEGLSLSCHKPERLGDSKPSSAHWTVGYRGKVSNEALETLDILCESNFIAYETWSTFLKISLTNNLW